MERRKFLRNAALVGGFSWWNPVWGQSSNQSKKSIGTAKNIIFMISDGMSIGTLNLANLVHHRLHGRHGNWIGAYHDLPVSRALMDTASASSMVTDSAAASSSFGSGHRVNNGVLNMGTKGEKYLPIWQKFQKQGKKVGCVTTVTVTHATPAGFCINSDKRNAETTIALQYLDMGIDVLLGGGDEHFNPALRADKQDVYAAYKNRGYQICKNANDLSKISSRKKLLGIFHKGALPYSIDQLHSTPEASQIPSLEQMTKTALAAMEQHPDGFALQVEAGKVDWAAHANDAAALIYDQLAFDEAVGVAIEFVNKNPDTLLIVTTDHGNANPGLIYGQAANQRLETVLAYTHTNEWLLNQINDQFNIQQIKDLVFETHQASISDEAAKKLLGYYTGLEKEDGLYNYKKLPYQYYGQLLKEHNNIGWISMDHSADYVELMMMGAGSEGLPAFVRNTDLHYWMLIAAGVAH